MRPINRRPFVLAKCYVQFEVINLKKISEAEIREEIRRLAQRSELEFLKRAIDHFQATGKRFYQENGTTLEVNAWTIRRYQELIQNKL